MFCFLPRKNTRKHLYRFLEVFLYVDHSFPEFYPAASVHLSFLTSELFTSAGPLGSLGSPFLHLQSRNCLQAGSWGVHSAHLICFPSSRNQSYRPLSQCLKTAVSYILFSFQIVHNERLSLCCFIRAKSSSQASVLVKREKKR